MKNDREYYGRAYRTVRIVRYLVLVILVLFAVFSLGIYKNDITFDNLRYLLRYVELASPGSTSGDGNIAFSASASDDFSMIGGKLCKVSAKEIVTWDLDGKKLLSESFSFQNPVAVENGDHILIYDFGGNNLCVYNSFSCVFEKKLATPIDYAYLSDDGAFALITNEKNYAGGVVAYDKNFKHVFTFMHPASAVTDVCFDGKSGILACATTDVQNGKFLSEILVFDTKSTAEEVKSSAFIAGELPLNMFCADENFAVMTDKGIHFFDKNCEKVAFTDFLYDTPCAIYRQDEFFAVSLKSAVASTDTKLLVLDYSGKKLFESSFSCEISHVDADKDHLFVLVPSELSVFAFDGEGFEEKTTVAHDGRYKKVFPVIDGRYILVSSQGSIGGKLEKQYETEEDV